MDSKPLIDDEVDLAEVFHSIWKGKWKILAIILIAIIGILSYQSTQPKSYFKAITEIKPISTFQVSQYKEFNSLDLNPITKEKLLDLYIEILDDKKLFVMGISKFELIDKANYKDELVYQEDVNKLASKIEIIPAQDSEDTKKISKMQGPYPLLIFKYNNLKKWKEVIEWVNVEANLIIKKHIKEEFTMKTRIIEQQRQFGIEDIQIEMKDTFLDYETRSNQKLAFLEEQAKIARSLDIAKNTFESQTFDSTSGTVANIGNNEKPPAYLSGYIALEKEIELIKSRDSKEVFIEELLELMKAKRKIEQSNTVQRAALLFADTPIFKKDFNAVRINNFSTKVESLSNKTFQLLVTIIIGGIVGIVYVLLSKLFRERQKKLLEE